MSVPVDRIVKTFDPVNDAAIRKAWAVEANSRLKEITSGKVDSIPGDVVLERVRQSLKNEFLFSPRSNSGTQGIGNVL